MMLGLLTIVAAVGLTQCGQLYVLHTSPSVEFRATNEILPESQVTNVIQSAFGLESEYSWDGMLAGGFFDRPKALLLISVTGAITEALNLTSLQIYDTVENDREPLSMQKVLFGLEDLSTDGKPVLFINLMVDKRHRVHLESGGVLPRVADIQLPITSPKIYIELNAISKTIATLSSHFETLRTDTPDLFHFHLSGLEHISDRHGPRSAQMTKAITSLNDVISQASSVFKRLYHDNLVVMLLTQPTSRHPTGYPSPVARRLLQETTASTLQFLDDLNLAPEFTWMYPALFNISLWFMVTFVLIVFGVGWCVWFTDPGRDGVIYRMTTHHVKQE